MSAEASETPYRIYAIDPEGKPDLLVATDDVSVGEQLLYLRRHGMTEDRTRIGIMYRERDDRPGIWLVNPFASGDSARLRARPSSTPEEETR